MKAETADWAQAAARLARHEARGPEERIKDLETEVTLLKAAVSKLMSRAHEHAPGLSCSTGEGTE